MSTEALEQLSRERIISLTTYRRDGRGVATPVGFVGEGEHLLIWTATTTGKVKRIRNNSQVTVAAGTARGEATGPEWAATATILPVYDKEQQNTHHFGSRPE